MTRPSDNDLFVRKLSSMNGRAANGQLRSALGWNQEKYWRVLQGLYDDGLIERGRGYGGTVLLVAANAEGTSSEDVTALTSATEAVADRPPVVVAGEPALVAELELYKPVLQQLQKHWVLRRQLDSCHSEITALQGRRDTGGSWSRPDLSVIGSRKFEHYPDKVFELHTFEVKAANDVTIKGVLEALAHREAATRAYVLYHTAGKEFSSYPESTRIEELASRHGVGVVAAHTIDD